MDSVQRKQYDREYRQKNKDRIREMQTFLPLPSLIESAKVLDNKRLGKQRVEAKQILETLRGRSIGWKNHPAVRMWKDHEPALAFYGLVICSEWRSRGFKDSLYDYFVKELNGSVIVYPSWFGDENFHASHRSNLLRKDSIFYSRFFWEEPSDLPYIWPV
jgi:hypothetical protein